MFKWNPSTKPEKKGRPKSKKSEEPSASTKVPPDKGPANLFNNVADSPQSSSTPGVVRERVRQIQSPPAASWTTQYNLKGGPKQRWVHRAKTFES
jgi:hypothetical protein